MACAIVMAVVVCSMLNAFVFAAPVDRFTEILSENSGYSSSNEPINLKLCIAFRRRSTVPLDKCETAECRESVCERTKAFRVPKVYLNIKPNWAGGEQVFIGLLAVYPTMKAWSVSAPVEKGAGDINRIAIKLARQESGRTAGEKARLLNNGRMTQQKGAGDGFVHYRSADPRMASLGWEYLAPTQGGDNTFVFCADRAPVSKGGPLRCVVHLDLSDDIHLEYQIAREYLPQLNEIDSSVKKLIAAFQVSD